MEPGCCGCKSLCPFGYKASVQPCVGERRRPPPLNPQLCVDSRPSQVRAPGQCSVGFWKWDLGQGLHLLSFPLRRRGAGWVFFLPFLQNFLQNPWPQPSGLETPAPKSRDKMGERRAFGVDLESCPLLPRSDPSNLLQSPSPCPRSWPRAPRAHRRHRQAPERCGRRAAACCRCCWP
jgi:hypothetical protein